MDVPITQNFMLAGLTFQESRTITGTALEAVAPSIPVAKAGTITTRTDANTGTLTMAAGHGIATGARLDIYFSNGLCRRGVVAGTVSGNSVPIDLGSGDDLPVTTTVIAAMVPIARDFSFTGDNMLMLAAYSLSEAQFTIVDAEDAELHYLYNPGLVVQTWIHGSGTVNPLAGDTPATVYISHSNIVSAVVPQIAALRS